MCLMFWHLSEARPVQKARVFVKKQTTVPVCALFFSKVVSLLLCNSVIPFFMTEHVLLSYNRSDKLFSIKEEQKCKPDGTIQTSNCVNS